MKVTDVTRVNAQYRLYRKAHTLRLSLKKRADYLKEPGAPNFLSVTIDLNEYISRLDNNELIPPPKWLHWPVEDVMTYCFGPCKPGPAQLDPFDTAIAEFMSEKGQKQRAATQAFYLQCALAQAHTRSWALLFNTLTVSSDHYHEVFNPQSRAFELYIRKIERLAARRAGVPKAEGRKHHQYFACVEEGGKTGRLHIHVLHMTSQTLTTSDPNKGSAAPCKRELPSLKQLWPYGFSSPIAVRYSNADAYSKLGWRWPYDSKTGKGIPVRPIAAIGGYMSKYVLKAYTSKARSNYLWRIRKTRNLGTGLLSQLTKQLTTTTLQAIVQIPTIRARINQQEVPPQALRLHSLKALQDRLSSKKVFDLARTLQPAASLLHSARASIQTTQDPNRLSTGPTPTFNLNDVDISNAQAELDSACLVLSAHYFPYTDNDRTTLSTRHISA